jgi:valyl-tRNA synthetase
MIKQYEAMFCRIVNCQELTVYGVNQEIPPSFATKLVFDITIGVQTIEPVNTKAVIAKLEDQLIIERKFITDLQSLLNSDGFVNSAPELVINAKKAKLEEVKNKVQQIEIEIQRLKYMG